MGSQKIPSRSSESRVLLWLSPSTDTPGKGEGLFLVLSFQLLLGWEQNTTLTSAATQGGPLILTKASPLAPG